MDWGNGVVLMNSFECVVIGAGPAGLGAAIAAAKCGVKVLVLDENNLPGGQLFKQIHKFFGSKEHLAGTRGFIIGQRLLQEAKDLNVKVLLNTRAWGFFPGNMLAYTFEGKTHRVKAKKFVIATGAQENAISFPGCTLPGVITAGAAQTMVNINRVLPGKNILMIGTGNVGLIVSYQLMQAGARVVGLVEAAPKVGGYAVHADKLRRANIPFYLSHTIVAARGNNQVEWAAIAPVDSNYNVLHTKAIELKVDTICLAVGLSPRIELPSFAGCRLTYAPDLGGFVPIHDPNMRAAADIYVAGDVAGVEEASTALEEGRLAGTAVAASLGYISPTQAETELSVIQKRIDRLRSGPFGVKRFQAKKMLHEMEAKGDGKEVCASS